MDIGGLRKQLDAQLRGRVPAWHPVGVVVEADGPVVRRHYGTHGTADHAPIPAGPDLDALVRRQREAFGARCEPVEWKVYGHDSPGLAEALSGAGFTAGWERSVLIAATDTIAPPRQGEEILRDYRVREQSGHIRELADTSGPHRTPPEVYEADGLSMDGEAWTDVLLADGLVVAAGWAELVDDTDFMAIGGLSRPEAAFVRAWADRWRGNRRGQYLLAEADDALRAELLTAGLREVTTVRSYHWTPPGTPEATRPAQLLEGALDDWALWERFSAAVDFKPSIGQFPGITEPAPSATWHLHAHHRPTHSIPERLDAIVQRGLLAVTEPGEFVHWLDWNHDGYRYDPRRTGVPGRPPRPGLGTYPDGDYYLHLTEDLRLGTFGHPWEQTLCVFGPLLAAVEGELTALLGEPVRRRG
ncbi:DUF2716 domain-containing protein [Streptomyces sp. ISL-21]|uniref:DUF2716 domain-containing protein n=1 Tax=Streptomyces sp. ISL-21 TaxID=2819179 RepID=UPI001BE9CEB7|nr:DUF2716 domain-containing protein [Streptomyces sp. ISL-21]MBT2408943.1 DUF2716 domain-containing protein [Streptomyces sp. ISL-21]